MEVLDVFNKQHEHILRVMSEIGSLLDGGAKAENAARYRALLSNLSGTLTVHLAMEDGSLYPRLAASTNPEARAAATRYSDEMRGLSGAFRAHLERWPSATAIREKPAQFGTEMKKILEALSKRIAFENAELYPMLKRLDG